MVRLTAAGAGVGSKCVREGRENPRRACVAVCKWVSRLALDASQTRRKFRPGSEEGKGCCHNPELGL